jgi:capsular polysaccharide transport system ATP-binding protein
MFLVLARTVVSFAAMIRFENVSKYYPLREGRRKILDGISFAIDKGESVGICGYNGAGKSTLLRLASGVEKASSGTVRRDMTVSWPIGHSSTFQSSLSGADNVRFIARIYNRPVADVLDFVDDFAELGSYLKMPVRTYSVGMTARLAFAVSLAVKFDCYLVDEITSAGDARFQQKCHDALVARKENSALLMVSHDPHILTAFCDRGAVLENGVFTLFATIDAAIQQHFGRSLQPA